MKKVAIIIVDRANHGRLLPVMEAIRAHPALSLHVICGGSTVLKRFNEGRPLADDIEIDGYPVDRVWVEYEGNEPLTMAKGIGESVKCFAETLQRLSPDVVAIIGDRYQAIGAAMAAATLLIPVVHLQGGEVSGALDERYRHAISKMSDFHWPATEQAKLNLLRMGESPDRILGVGCPSSDLAKRVRVMPGESITCAYHPDTANPCDERLNMLEILKALAMLKRPARVLWPNIDATSDSISKAIRQFGEHSWLSTIKNLPPFEYMERLSASALCIGNSSSFVRDASFFGTSVLLIGTRQDGRESGAHVMHCHDIRAEVIAGRARDMLRHGRHAPSSLYGDGHVSERIVEALVKLPPYRHKRLSYMRRRISRH